MKFKHNIAVSAGAALVFSLLYIAGALTGLEDRLYDFFLKFRRDRERIDNVVFLDVDDSAISYNGVFPWPRSIPADGLLRLKEYGALAAIFDIEYIDNAPQGVDDLYLNQGLKSDFANSFYNIRSGTLQMIEAITSGRQSKSDISRLTELINAEHDSLYAKAQRIARDNDLYLEQAKILNGRAWSTLNLRAEGQELSGEEAERRPEIAERLFAYPIKASSNAHKGAGFIDVLTALPRFAFASKGAGFTNVEIDPDGVRRRVYLAQNIQDHWYLQLSFAPLINYLDNPEVELTKDKLTIKQAKMPDGRIKDIKIPLDSKGRMMLDWPKTDYINSYKHVSFERFSLLSDLEAESEYYVNVLNTDVNFFPFIKADASIDGVTVMLNDIVYLFNEAKTAKEEAMLNNDDEAFIDYLFYRNQAFSFLRNFILLDIEIKVEQIALEENQKNPGSETAEYLLEEADYISQLVSTLSGNLQYYMEETEYFEKIFKNNFVIMGRSDTGTTDYGANPFYNKYINVGTHGVVLDTILSENFIIPLGIWWRIVFMIIFIPLLFFITAGFHPVKRAITSFLAALAIFAASILMFRLTGVYWGPLGVILAIVIAVITREIMEYASSEKEKQFIRTAFSTYLSGDVVKEIIADPSRMQLGGTKRNMTAIFTDVKAFSTISEKLDPEELVSLLNKYLSAMSDIILEEKGTIDKYEGDAIIAFFGAPIELPDHALRACISAIKIKKAEIELNKEIMAQKLSPMPLLTRVGINTGFMVVGNMGTANKMNYTIMGDSVNLAARLEGVNKQYGTWLLTSEDTIKETGDKLLYRKLDRVRVVGKSEPVRLCELIDEASLASEQDKKLVAFFHEALALFESRDWKFAAEGFKHALAFRADDEPAKMYLERCEKFIAEPPKEDWDGVYNLTSK